eukprot:748887-Hanusia_phi.AAC.2
MEVDNLEVSTCQFARISTCLYVKPVFKHFPDLSRLSLAHLMIIAVCFDLTACYVKLAMTSSSQHLGSKI